MSGMEKIKKYKWYLFPLIALIIINIAVAALKYNSYKDETIVLAQVITENKSEEITFKEAENILEKYGYAYNGKTITYKNYIELIEEMIILSLVLYVIIIISLRQYKKQLNKNYLELISLIESELDLLKEGIYSPSKSELKEYIKYDYNHIISRLDTLLESLYNTILLEREKTKDDKLDTKVVVTDISHQLKTPLAAIKSTFEIMQNANLNSEEREEIENLMGFQINSLEKLILSLINISRLEGGMIEINLSEGNLFDSILDSVNGVWSKADEKNISIEFDNPEDEQLPKLMRDKKWLTEAFINILDNAVKYSKENTEIHINVLSLNTMIRIEFKDQGIGIPDNEKHKIFKRFYRGNKEDVCRETGSGVGLYLARYIISKHRGTIMVKDNFIDGKKLGSIFVVQLPILKESLTSL